MDIHELIDELALSPFEASCKPRIRLHPGEAHLATAAADCVMAERPFFQFGGSILRISEAPDGSVAMQRLNEHGIAVVLASAVHWERKVKEGWVQCEPPRQVIHQLLFGTDLQHIRRLDGLARQPFLRPDGTLVIRPGYDPQSRIYGAFRGEEYVFGTSSEQTARRAYAELSELIAEFPTASDADRSAIICLLLTAAIRPSVSQAPAFSISAPMMGTGKTLIAKIAAQFASPDHPYAVSYPTTPEEATKLIPAMLIEKPAVILFDDMQNDWLPHGAVNKALTSPTITERILGSSRTTTVRTNSLFVGTGNDIEPVGDMRRRVVSIRLEPDDDTPALRRFSSDPLAEVRNNRARFVMAALEIIRAYQAVGMPKTHAPPIGTYEEWSAWCRQPLLWLGLPDPATSLIKQVNHDADQDTRKHFLIALYERFDSEPILVQEIIKAAARDDELMDALADLPVMSGNTVNAKKLGWYLKTKCRRLVGGFKVEPCDAPQQRRAWRVVRLGRASAPAAAETEWTDEMGEMSGRPFHRFPDDDDWTPRPRKKAYAGR